MFFITYDWYKIKCYIFNFVNIVLLAQCALFAEISPSASDRAQLLKYRCLNELFHKSAWINCYLSIKYNDDMLYIYSQVASILGSSSLFVVDYISESVSMIILLVILYSLLPSLTLRLDNNFQFFAPIFSKKISSHSSYCV